MILQTRFYVQIEIPDELLSKEVEARGLYQKAGIKNHRFSHFKNIETTSVNLQRICRGFEDAKSISARKEYKPDSIKAPNPSNSSKNKVTGNNTKGFGHYIPLMVKEKSLGFWILTFQGNP